MARDPDCHDEGKFYSKWKGKRSKAADVITWSEVELLEDVMAPSQLGYDYFGPILGTRHDYGT